MIFVGEIFFRYNVFILIDYGLPSRLGLDIVVGEEPRHGHGVLQSRYHWVGVGPWSPEDWEA